VNAASRYLAIVNPQAGGGRCRARYPAAVERLRGLGVEVEVMETRGPGHATELARARYAEGWRHFLAVGGDGTTYEVANGLFPEALEAEERPCLGLLPLGTGNSFLRDFTGDGVEHSLQAIAEGRRRPCDVIRVTHAGGALYYLNLLSLGFVADVCKLANQRFKALGEGGYTAGVLAKLVRLRTRAFPMSLDGGTEDSEPLTLVSFCNSRFTGGNMEMAPGADPCDGQGDLVRLEAVGRLGLLGAFRRIFQGTHVDLPTIRTARFRSVEFSLDGEVPVMLDGEVLDLRLERLDVLASPLDLVL
jgi:YegS/Rv2252/BmrU family lipid kinase